MIGRWGSPPHTRGKVQADRLFLPSDGITPAHAGKSKHPEYKRYMNLGSPPHTRGKDLSAINLTPFRRITPAHAGKSRDMGEEGRDGQDHPRTRGEKKIHTIVSIDVAGSPPHTRGKARNRRRSDLRIGITPAHAGKSTMTQALFLAEKDHPRTRGEKAPFPPLLPFGIGSPPHTRGKVQPLQKALVCGRITPAHAGKRRICP